MTNPANVNVICRFRPMNDLEKTSGNETVVEFTSQSSLSFHSSREKNVYQFTFDRIFPPTATQLELYDFGAKAIIDSVLNGYNGTVLAYGQTSSGKTYTMEGEVDKPAIRGIIPRMVDHVFEHIYKNEGIEFILKVSMIEIYQEKIRDLIDLSKINLNIREDSIKGIYVDGVSEHYVARPGDILELLAIGSSHRAQAATYMNEHSSRSHSIFILTINQNNKKEGYSKIGKLYLVDLAGSEKISKTGVTGHTLEEAKIINKSLTTLGRVINNLTDGKSTHIPYRESKLTRVLQESLGGNSKTCLIITCSPSAYNESESLSTLRFGERAKKIKNKPKINKEITVAELQKLVLNLKDTIKKADCRISQLEEFIKANGLTIPESNYQKEEDEEQKSKQRDEREKIKDEENKIEELKNKLVKEKIPIAERINNILNLATDNNEEDNRIELVANLKALKEKYDKIENRNNNNENPAIEGNNSQNNNLNNNNGKISDIFLSKIKNFKEIQENPEILEFINNYQSQFQKNSTENSDKNIIFEKSACDKEIQTEKLEGEYDRNAELHEKEKRVLYKQIDDHETEINNLKREIEELKEKKKVWDEQTPFIEKKVREKNSTLESNLRDLRRKLEESQIQRIMCENQNNALVKSMREKNVCIGNLEKEIAELKANSYNKSNQPVAGNIYRVITGGQQLKNK